MHKNERAHNNIRTVVYRTSILCLSLLLTLIVACAQFPCNAILRYRAMTRQLATTNTNNNNRNIRNVALVGHSHSGKSSLAEWIMFNGNVLSKRPNSKESCLDSDPVEANRHSSVFSHFVRVPSGQYLLELTDTPWGDFPSDAAAATNGADAAVLLVSAADSVQAGTNTAFHHCRKSGIKLLLALSKMDRPFVQVEQVLSAVEDNLGVKPQPLQVPIGEGEAFQGVKSLLQLDSQTGTVIKNAAVDDDPDLECGLDGIGRGGRHDGR